MAPSLATDPELQVKMNAPMSDEQPAHALLPGHKIGGYSIVRVIGQGGFGIVYEARNPITLAHVAIKEFYPSSLASRQGGTIILNYQRERDLYASVLKRFEQEAKLQFDLDHPNIGAAI
jgi:serine/threonine protein kinase